MVYYFIFIVLNFRKSIILVVSYFQNDVKRNES